MIKIYKVGFNSFVAMNGKDLTFPRDTPKRCIQDATTPGVILNGHIQDCSTYKLIAQADTLKLIKENYPELFV